MPSLGTSLKEKNGRRGQTERSERPPPSGLELLWCRLEPLSPRLPSCPIISEVGGGMLTAATQNTILKQMILQSPGGGMLCPPEVKVKVKMDLKEARRSQEVTAKGRGVWGLHD